MARSAPGTSAAGTLGLIAVNAMGYSVVEFGHRADEVGADATMIGPGRLGAIGQSLRGAVSSGLLQTARRPAVVVLEGL